MINPGPGKLFSTAPVLSLTAQSVQYQCPVFCDSVFILPPVLIECTVLAISLVDELTAKAPSIHNSTILAPTPPVASNFHSILCHVEASAANAMEEVPMVPSSSISVRVPVLLIVTRTAVRAPSRRKNVLAAEGRVSIRQ